MSNSFALELQKGFRAALVANSGVTALVATRVYDEPPQNVTYPFIRFGDLQSRSADTDGKTGAEVTFNIETYANHRARGSNTDCRGCSHCVASFRRLCRTFWF